MKIKHKLKDEELIHEIDSTKGKDSGKAPEENEIKRPDLQGNPSIWDILDAIEGTINAGVIGPRRKWVTDLYPIKYPSGNVIIGIREEEVKYYLYSYTYDDGKIIFGEVTELEQTYTPKKELSKEPTTEQFTQAIAALVDEVKSLKEGRVLSEKNRKLIRSCVTQMGEAITALNALMQATEPPKQEEIQIEENEKKAPKEEKLTKEEVIKIFKDIKSESIDYRALAKKEINKARGKVE